MDKKTILIVDDTKSNIDILIDLLGSTYDLVVSLDGEGALAIVAEEKVDLILLDIIMPGIDGYQVCRTLKLKEETKHIPIIFITSSTDVEAIEKAYDVGGNDYVSKPFNPRELLVRVENQLELKYLIDTLEEKVQIQVEEVLKTKELLLQNSRMAQMGEMISMIAHQWRQPLAAISAVTSGLETKVRMGIYERDEKEGLEACQKKILVSTDKINEFVHGLSRTIDDFRNFFKPNKEMQVSPVNVPIAKALKIIEASLDAENIKIILDSTSSKNIEMYDSELIQVMLNILKNAQDNFRDKKTKDAHIIIQIRDIDDGVEVKFIDNGGGIDSNIIAYIFDPYFSTKSEKTGTGLGLSMSRTIVHNHHQGSIRADNTEDGVCFTIILKEQIEKNSKA